MTHKRLLSRILSHTIIVFVIAGFMYSYSDAEPVVHKNTAHKKTSVIALKDNRHLVVYYFHGNARCPTCYKLEGFAKSEVETDFADAIKSGKLEWKTVNVEEKGNEHFVDDYKLYTKSIIVSVHQNGKETSWKNLDSIWQLVHDQSKYREYIKNDVKACLEGKCL